MCLTVWELYLILINIGSPEPLEAMPSPGLCSEGKQEQSDDVKTGEIK